MERTQCPRQNHCHGLEWLARKEFLRRRGSPASFPFRMLGLAPRDRSWSASEENARASHLVERHRTRSSTAGSRISRPVAVSLSGFLLLYPLRLVAVAPTVFCLPFAPATLFIRLLDHGMASHFARMRCGLRDLPRGAGRLSRDGTHGSKSAGLRVRPGVYQSDCGDLERPPLVADSHHHGSGAPFTDGAGPSHRCAGGVVFILFDTVRQKSQRRSVGLWLVHWREHHLVNTSFLWRREVSPILVVRPPRLLFCCSRNLVSASVVLCSES